MQSKYDWMCWEVNHISVSHFFISSPYESYSLPLSVFSYNHNNQINFENKFASHHDKVQSVNELSSLLFIQLNALLD
jgi:hypothetical protein